VVNLTGMEDSLPREEGLSSLFYPRSIAVIGASTDPKKIGGRPISQLKTLGFPGAIYPVNSRHTEIQGIPAFDRVSSVLGKIDIAIIAVPTTSVVDAIEECAACSVKVAIIFSAGFAEIGDAGAYLQKTIKTIARSSGMRLLGPNCIGVAHVAERTSATFAFAMGLPTPEGPLPRVALVSQSGAVGGIAYALSTFRSMIFDPWVTTGNEADIDVADCIAFLAKDDSVSAIATYLEGCQNGDRLKTALEIAADRGKPVVALKAGNSEAGAMAAVSHTASLVGSVLAYDSLFAKYGVCKVTSLAELVDVSHALAIGSVPMGRRIAILTGSGGQGILAADAATERGLEVTPLSAAAQKRLKAIWPPSSVGNPIDTTAQVTNDAGLLKDFLDVVVEEDHDVIVVLLAYLGMMSPWSDRMLTAMTKTRESHPDAKIIVSVLATREVQNALARLHIPVYEELTSAIKAAASLVEIGEAQERWRSRVPVDLRTTSAPILVERGVLTEQAAKRLLSEAGIPVIREVFVESSEAAALAAEELGLPVAMKVVSPQVTHKTEAGGVVLDITSSEDAANKYHQIVASVAKVEPEANILGVLVAPMITGGVETILGAKIDPILGPIVLFGLGGIYVESLNDFSYRVAPLNFNEAAEMIRDIKGFNLLDGARSRPKADLNALASALSHLSILAAANSKVIESIDVNPFIVLPEGQGAFAVDALVVGSPSATA